MGCIPQKDKISSILSLSQLYRRLKYCKETDNVKINHMDTVI
jgi:hypothetical protein